jgi:NAD(P)-dependent dehydrogenase (short-subunit alcohol dehydrogenase family)
LSLARKSSSTGAPLSDALDAGMKGRLAIVTGATGIAGASVRRLARAGVHQVLAGRDFDGLQAIVASLAGSPGRAIAIRCDLAKADEVAALVDGAKEFGKGRIDILLNGAGTIGLGHLPAWELPTEDFDRVLAANLRAVFLTMKFTLPNMIAARYGRIVNIGGTFGLKGVRHRSQYSSSKWGVRGLTRSAALDAGPYGITANTICPGYVNSIAAHKGIREEAERMGLTPDEVARLHASTMALRHFVEPEDIAAAVMLLAGPEGVNITGQEIVVDAGAVV